MSADKPTPRDPETPPRTVIKALGLGGGGSNAINRMIELGFIEGVEFIASNTDAQALNSCLAPTRLQLGPRTTRGLGAGGKPEVGESAAEESRADIRQALANADMVFLTAGMGGGTGTGAIAVAAEAAQSLGAITIAIVTMPFSFEGPRRKLNAEIGLERLRPHVHTLIAVQNDRLLPLVGRDATFEVALRVADEVLRQGLGGLAELISRPGLINVDFAHVRKLVTFPGEAMMAIGQGRGDSKVVEAAAQALKMPLIDAAPLSTAAGVLVNFTGGDDMTLHEVSQAAEDIQRAAPQAELVFGITVDPIMAGRAQVLIVATGLAEKPRSAEVRRRMPVMASVPKPEPVAPVSAPAAGESHLAEALFNSAVPKAVHGWPAMAEMSPAAANNLDIPAFLRRRRSLQELEGSK